MIDRHLCILHLSVLAYSSGTYSTLVVFLDDFDIKENSLVFCYYTKYKFNDIVEVRGAFFS